MKKCLAVFAILIFSLFSCIDEIDFQSPRNIQDAISIQAKFVHGSPSELVVEVKKVFDFTGVPQNINVREVRLTNVSTGQSLVADGAGVDIYTIEIPQNSSDMNLNYMDEYSVRVETLNGEIYESNTEQIIPSPGPPQVSHKLVQQLEPNVLGDLEPRDYLQYAITGTTVNPLTPDLTRLRWSFEQAYQLTDAPEDASVLDKICYVIRNKGANLEVVRDPNERREAELQDFPVIDVTIGSEFAEGNYIIIYQHTLTEAAYQYFNQVNQVVSLEGNLFDAPAGKVSTNFSSTNGGNEEVFGYFYMTEIDTLRHYVSPEFLGNPRRRCPPVFSSPPPRPCFVESCCDCLLQEGSTTVKPSWWIN